MQSSSRKNGDIHLIPDIHADIPVMDISSTTQQLNLEIWVAGLPGPKGILPTSPSADAPYRTASLASSIELIQQILTRDIIMVNQLGAINIWLLPSFIKAFSHLLIINLTKIIKSEKTFYIFLDY